MGGKVDGCVSSSTDSGVRVGQRVHNGHGRVAPAARRAVSDTTTSSKSTLPRYETHTTVVEKRCTTASCSHCCDCHVDRNDTGYGTCMLSTYVPHPNCRCKGKCKPGRCGQPECASNRILIDFSSPESDSTMTLMLAATPTRSPAPHYLRLTHHHHHHNNNNNTTNMTAATTLPMCVSRLTPAHSHRLYLVCVEKLAASMQTRRFVSAHKLMRTPRLLRPTVSPQPLSTTAGQ